MNIVGDVAGQFDALMALVKKMPDEPFMFLGDLNDRGPKSKEVIDWVMKNADSTMGNHEHLMLNEVTGGDYYERGLWWTTNGGLWTLKSYGCPELEFKKLCDFALFAQHAYRVTEDDYKEIRPALTVALQCIPKEHIEWLKSRPLYWMNDHIFISHAAWHNDPNRTLEDCCQLGNGFYHPVVTDRMSENSLIWNRGLPRKRDGLIQVFGHMAHKTPLFYSDSYKDGIGYYRPEHNPWAVGIDTSRSRTLTGLNWPSMEIYQVSYE